MSTEFEKGDVVQLRSGGPLVTVFDVTKVTIGVIYYNSIDGRFESFNTRAECLKHANTVPSAPEGARHMRQSSSTTIPKSSLS